MESRPSQSTDLMCRAVIVQEPSLQRQMTLTPRFCCLQQEAIGEQESLACSARMFSRSSPRARAVAVACVFKEIVQTVCL